MPPIDLLRSLEPSCARLAGLVKLDLRRTGLERLPTALPPIVVSAPPTPTPAEAALEQMYVALPFHQRRA